MRNAVASGILSIFQGVCGFGEITHWWTQSSGAQTTVAFVTGQIEKTRDIWIRELTSRRLCGVRSLLACKRMADVDHLVDHCCRGVDFSLLDQSSATVFVGVVNVETAETEYHQICGANARELLKATCALPTLARPVVINGTIYIDGGTLDPLPVATIMKQVDRLLIFDNRPKYAPEPRHRGIERILFPGNYKLQREFAQRPQRLARSWELIRQFEAAGRVLVVAPPVLVASRLCRNPAVIEQAWLVGEETARAQLTQVRSFLET
jgi:predicted patatin/cPLA2 family phospholipase